MQARKIANKELIDSMREFLIIHAPGAANAVTIEAIRQCFNLPTRRDVEHVIEILRMDGLRVCSSCRKPCGVFVAVTPDEVRDYVRQLNSRKVKLQRTINAVLGRQHACVKPDAVALMMEMAV